MMTSNLNPVIPTRRYNIKEACTILGIHRNTLRRYTDEGAIKCLYNRQTMRKYYTGLEIIKLCNTMI